MSLILWSLLGLTGLGERHEIFDMVPPGEINRRDALPSLTAHEITASGYATAGGGMRYQSYENTYEHDINPKNITIGFDNPILTSADYIPELLALLIFLYAICAHRRLSPIISFMTFITRLAFVVACIAPVLFTVQFIHLLIPMDSTINALMSTCASIFHPPDIDFAFMLAGDNEVDDHDSRKYNKCRPYSGKKGISFEIWARDFQAAMAGEYIDSNDMNNLEETMLGTDIGGDVYLAGGGAGANQVETRRRNKRLRVLYSHIYRHVNEPRLREMIASQANNDGRAAFQLLVRNCRERVTDLEMQAQDMQFDGVSIEKDIGCSADTITLLDRLLCGLNARRPADRRKTDDQMTLKLLSCLSHTFSISLNMEAQKEIRAQPAARMFQDNTANQRDYGAARDYYDDLWRAQYAAGAIKPCPRRGATGSVRADGAALASASDDDAFVATTGRDIKQFTRFEIGKQLVCWCCRGFGHTKDQCPSDRGFRPIDACVYWLGQRLSNSNNRGAGGSRGAGAGGRGAPGRGRGRGNITFRRNAIGSTGLIIDDSGVVYSADGEPLGTMEAESADAAQPADPEPAGPSDEQAAVAVEDDGFDDGDGWEDQLGGTITWDRSGALAVADASDYSESDTASVDLGANRFSSLLGLDESRISMPVPPSTVEPEAVADESDIMLEIDPSSGYPVGEMIKFIELRDQIAKPVDSGVEIAEPVAVTDLSDVPADTLLGRSATTKSDDSSTIPDLVTADTFSFASTPIPNLVTDTDSSDTTYRSSEGAAPMRRRRRSLLVLIVLAFTMLAATLFSGVGSMHDSMFPVVSSVYSNSRKSDLIVDCGATKHCIFDEKELTTITDANPRHYVTVGNGTRMRVSKVGTMDITVPTEHPAGQRSMHLTNVLCVPGMPWRLFSCRWAFEHDQIQTHLNDENYLRLPDGARVPFKQTDRHYVIESALAATDNATCDDGQLMHERLAHFSVARINAALARSDDPEHTRINLDPRSCAACSLNAKRRPKPTAAAAPTNYTYFGQRVTSDTCGPFPESPHGYTHAINFYDCYSKYSVVYFLKGVDSSSILLATQTFMSEHKHLLTNTTTSGVVDQWHTDNAGGFMSDDIDTFCAELGTRRSFSVPHVHERNTYSERVWGILLRPMRTMLAHAGNDSVFHSLWPFAMKQACHIHNRLPSRALDPPMSPHERLYGKPPGLDDFHVMFCDCDVPLHDGEVPSKLSSPRVKAVYIGYDERRNGHHVFIPELDRITTHLDVNFDEHRFSKVGSTVAATKPPRRHREQRDMPVPVNRSTLPNPRAPVPLVEPTGDDVTVRIAAPPPPPTQPTPQPSVRLVMSRGGAPDTSCVTADDDDVHDIFACLCNDAVPLESYEGVAFRSSSVGESYPASMPPGPVPIPKSADEALNDPIFGDKWRESMMDDIHGKVEINKGWHLVKDLPPGRKAMKGKWVFKVLYNDDGSVARFKSRWVGKGFTQVPHVDYHETYCSTLRAEIMRLFLAEAAASDNELLEIDHIKAFTQGDMDDCELYVEQPHGFVDPKYAACRLTKPLEGTCQAGHLFMVSNADTLENKCGFNRSMTEPNIFWRERDGILIKIGVYVDNVLLSYPKGAAAKAQIDEFITVYKQRFNIDVRGPPREFMGIEILRNRGARTLTITQTKYIEKAYAQYLSGTCTKGFTSPVASTATDKFMRITTAADDTERAAMRQKPFLSLMGTLLWATMTHPEVAYYVGFLCQCMHDPSLDAYEAGLAILAYLYNARSLGITYNGNDPTVNVFTDASWGQSPAPFGGHVVFYCGGAVGYQSRKLKIVPQSTAEAETAVYATAAKDLQFIINVLGSDGLQAKINLPIAIHTDNEAAVSTIKNPGATARTRHYERWVLYGREQYLKRTSFPVHVYTKNQIADIFTKALDKTSFLKFRDALLNNPNSTTFNLLASLFQ